MPYLGNGPATAYTSTTKDTFSGDGSTTDFTLSKAGNNNALRVVVENVVQDPGVAYTCVGTTLAFTSAPPTGTSNIYVVHLGPPAATVAPPTTINNATTFTADLTVDTNTLYVDSTNNRVGVLNTSPSHALDVTQTGATSARVGGTGGTGANDGTVIINNGGTGDAMLRFDYETNTDRARIGTSTSSQQLEFYTAGNNERMRIDDAGRVMIGTTTEGAANEAEDLTISSTGQVGITIRSTDSGGGRIYFSDGTSGTPEYAGYQIYNHSSNAMIFGTNAVERMSISSAGSTTLTSANDHPLILNRTGNTGVFAEFKEGGTSRGTLDGNGTRLLIRSIGSASGLRMDGGNITPFYGGGESDNGIDLGYSGGRFKTVFAGTGSINTSDKNEKQDIEELTDAEKRVAVAAKGLLRKYKFKDAVEKKGDKARIHFGIIAQDLEDAFTAEGLDASKYAFWCKNTWWEKEITIGSKKSYKDIKKEETDGYTKYIRLGVRYTELLSFLSAYNEQRFASIEARLTALESK